MSNKRYRSRPGQPRTETEAMIRAMAMELLDGALAELSQEIGVLQRTVELYDAEVIERSKNPGKNHGRWQVAPGVAMRAMSMLRRLRKERDAMLAEAEAEVVEMARTAPNAPQDEAKAPEQPGNAQVDWQTIAKDIAKHGATVSSPATEKRKPDQVAA